jgi:hypothetical protein
LTGHIAFGTVERYRNAWKRKLLTFWHLGSKKRENGAGVQIFFLRTGPHDLPLGTTS